MKGVVPFLGAFSFKIPRSAKNSKTIISTKKFCWDMKKRITLF
jgi:hypothetical protein